MLIIISDLHLTDGSTGKSISEGAFRIFRDRIGDMAFDASKRADGSYQPLEEFDIVLLGDILDISRSTLWNREAPGDPGYVRPWHDLQSNTHINKIDNIVDAILSENARSLRILRSIRNGIITLPPPTPEGRVQFVSRNLDAPGRLPLKVNIHYMVGNHDWYLHLNGTGYEKIRQKINREMGLSDSVGPYPHDPSESEGLQKLFAKHGVFARHGDIYDSLNYDAARGRNFPSLGDALLIELFNPFPETVADEFDDELPDDFYRHLRELGNTAPITMAPVWIAGSMRKFGLDDAQREKINAIWDRLVERFLDSDFLELTDRKGVLDYVDAIRPILKLTSPLDIEQFSQAVLLLKKRLTTSEYSPSLLDALHEPAFVERQARYIVYGHTHHHRVTGLEAAEVDAQPFQQLYINAGTWRPVYSLAEAHPKNMNFVSYKTMTMLAFYRPGERKGRPFETWSGTLGLNAAEAGI